MGRSPNLTLRDVEAAYVSTNKEFKKHLREDPLGAILNPSLESGPTGLENTNPTGVPTTMEWTTPKHEEIELNCEVSSYANAEL